MVAMVLTTPAVAVVRCVTDPGHEGSTGELRAVVGTHRLRVAPEDGGLVQ
jgi:hypothetical protein